MSIARRTTTCALLALACAMAMPSIAAARTSAQYRVEGRGWGHGIGMSQYGAQGYAEHGWTSEQIIEHYYTGTVVAARPTSGPSSVRVLLKDGLMTARLQMESAGIVRKGAVSMTVLEQDVLLLRASGSSVSVTRVREGSPDMVLAGGGNAQPVIDPTTDGGVKTLFTGDYASAGTSYRGTITAFVSGGKVSVVNVVPFEDYVRGVVPRESPSSWRPAALEAQAIAARSYALRGLRSGAYDLYSDTRSQVYGGMDAEMPSSDAAVLATAGKVAHVGSATGEVAQTFFFSTSAGRTAANEDVWGSSPYSYLRSVSSPYETASPYFFWKGSDIQRYTPRQLGMRLGVSGVRSASVTLHPSGYVDDVVLRTARGATTTSASSVQYRLGLRSTYFRLQLLSLTSPAFAREGKIVTLTGMISPSGRTSLIIRRAGSPARTVALTKRNAAGAWRVRMRMTNDLRVSLTRSGIIGPSATIRTMNPVDVVVD